jgi:hypothetical protein
MFHLFNIKEETMNTIPLEDHIHELRLELRYCALSSRERAETERQLSEAAAELDIRNRELDEALAAWRRGRRR